MHLFGEEFTLGLELGLELGLGRVCMNRIHTHLRDFVGEHVAIVVVGNHPESAVSPPDDLG